MAHIRDLMVTDTISVRPTESVLVATKRMTANRVGAVLVIESDALWGLLSERDVVDRVVAAGRDPATTDAASVATRDVVAVDVNSPFREVLRIFREKRFRHLPVMEKGRPVGILSTRDFLSYLVDGLERYIDAKKYSEQIDEGSDPYDHAGGAYGK